MISVNQKVTPFVSARFSRNNNLVLTIAPHHNGPEYEAYLGIITETLRPLGNGRARISEKWAKYVVHNVPTDTDLVAAGLEFEKVYNNLKLAQASRWLTTIRRSDKAASALVLAFTGSVSLKALGTKHLIFNGT